MLIRTRDGTRLLPIWRGGFGGASRPRGNGNEAQGEPWCAVSGDGSIVMGLIGVKSGAGQPSNLTLKFQILALRLEFWK